MKYPISDKYFLKNYSFIISLVIYTLEDLKWHKVLKKNNITLCI